MPEDREKPPGKAPPQSPAPGKSESGQLGLDDRGNVTWEWADADELPADDPLGRIERLTALDDPTLQIEDENFERPSPGPASPAGRRTGYDPYDSGRGVESAPTNKKRKSLQELSKWIELRKKVAQKDEDPEQG